MSSCNKYILCIRIVCCLIFAHTSLSAQKRTVETPLLYGIFNNDSSLETRIIPIFSSGLTTSDLALSKGFQLPANDNTSFSNEWYGSAALAADPGSGLLFYASKELEKQSFWAISKTGKHFSLNPGKIDLTGHSLTKMAMGPDGYVYALSTCLRNKNSTSGKETILVRFKACTSPGCSQFELLGHISSGSQYRNADTYSGDIAFSASGDMYIFGTTIDPIVNYYTGALIYRIRASELKLPVKRNRTLDIQFVGQVKGMGREMGMDSVIITGAAFEPSGDFVLATIDKYVQKRVRFYKGSSMGPVTNVYPVFTELTTPPGFVISDLASVYRPTVTINRKQSSQENLNMSASSIQNVDEYIKLTTFNTGSKK
jgi:hypothetical protein